MQSEERELISGLFGRLQPFETQPRDGEAEALIKDSIARQPAAPYLLVQTVLVQEQALKAAQERIVELEAKVAGAGAAPASPGFLGSAPRIGPWGAQPGTPPAPQAAPPPPAPSTRSPLQAAVAPQAGGGGGFLRTAMMTAAGVAGGALLFEGIRSLMGSNPGAFGPALGSSVAAAQPSPLLPPDSMNMSPDNQMNMSPDTQQQAFADDDDSGSDDSGGDYDTADSDVSSSDDDFA